MKFYLDIEETKGITKTKLNKVTRRALEKNITGETFAKDFISTVNGVNYVWCYRKHDGIWSPRCKKEDADLISVYSNCGKYLKDIIL